MTTTNDLTSCDFHSNQVRLADGRTWACQGCGAWLDDNGQELASGAQVAEAARDLLAEQAA